MSLLNNQLKTAKVDVINLKEQNIILDNKLTKSERLQKIRVIFKAVK
jgi:hypothetical protein